MPEPSEIGRITRLAPSPTGALHLGNARTFLINWAMAKQRGWRVLLRIEDFDTPRVKPESVKAIPETLRWLGMDWDEGPLVQSHDLSPYRAALSRLRSAGVVYPCRLSRTQIESASSASAPQEGSHEIRFSAELRPVSFHQGTPWPEGPLDENWRLAVNPGTVEFVDAFAGRQRIDPSASVGDFLVWTKRGVPAYQLAVVVDDARQGVTDVVRGDDLLDSAARQLLLYKALGLGTPPRYWHLPLVVGEDGRRLAKRHGDTRVDFYRDRGVPAEAVIGLIARWCGMTDRPEPMTAEAFARALSVDTIPRTPITFRQEDHRWLLSAVR